MPPPAWFRDLGGADPYQLLRVPGGATAGEITRAYRQRILELHPDRASGDADEARLANLARDVLLDPVRRAEYDRLAAEPEPEPPRSAWDTEDVVVGADPGTAPSAWETEDVVVGAEPPPPPPSVAPAVPYQQPYYYPPGYPAAYPVAPAPSLNLAIAALVCSVLCVPVGLILGIVAMQQHRHVPGNGRVLAITAIAVSSAFLLLSCVCYGGGLLSALSNPA